MKEEYMELYNLEDFDALVEKLQTLLAEKKYTVLKQALEKLNEADIAELFEEMDEKEIPVLYRLLGKEEAADTFARMSHELQVNLINALTDIELRQVMDDIYLDDTVDMIEEMPANVVSRVLHNTDAETRKLINEILNYPKDSAGSIMTVEYVNIKKFMTVKEAIARIRKTAVDKETIYTCYVTENRKLIGIITVKDLLIAEDDQKIEDIMETNMISVTTHDDKEKVAKMFHRYDFLAIPVVDNENRLVGIVTFDDAIDVLQDENTEDITKMAAMMPAEDTYFRTSVFSHAKHRIVWLLVLMLSATITGTIISKYEHAFAAIPLLVSFIPMLMDTGGNCGSQSSTLVIRGIALDEIRFRDLFKVVFKEFRIAMVVGVVLSVVNGLRILIFYKNAAMAMVVALSLMVTIVVAKMIGCALPLLAKKVHMDPAVMAAPLITTIVDTCSILVYFNIATVFFNI